MDGCVGPVVQKGPEPGQNGFPDGFICHDDEAPVSENLGKDFIQTVQDSSLAEVYPGAFHGRGISWIRRFLFHGASIGKRT